MERHIDLKKLSLDELAGVINLYPWFGSARKELCERMIAMGGNGWEEEQFAEAAMYLPSRRIIAGMLHSSRKEDYTDRDLSRIIRHYISETRENTAEGMHAEHGGRTARSGIAGGDYFSQQEYERVRKDSDMVFSGFKAGNGRERTHEDSAGQPDLGFYTETLARIYAEQGYCEHAIRIYEKLILAYPEKNAYFAALIEKLKTED